MCALCKNVAHFAVNKKYTMKNIQGYSKLTKEQKIDWLVSNYLDNDETAKQELISYWMLV